MLRSSADGLCSLLDSYCSHVSPTAHGGVVHPGHCTLQGGSVGLEQFEGVVSAAASAMRSPLDEELSVGATWTLQSVAKRLAEAPQSVSLSTHPSCPLPALFLPAPEPPALIADEAEHMSLNCSLDVDATHD